MQVRFAILLFAAVALTCRGAVFTVSVTSASGPGSLTQAILDANANFGLDRIVFALPNPGVQTIKPLGALPEITDPVVIDGTTQAGYAGSPLVELSGSGRGYPYGLKITGGQSTIQGLTINGFGSDAAHPGYGIWLASEGNRVLSCRIGVDSAGKTFKGNSGAGIFVDNSSDNQIGGTSEGEGNLISGGGAQGILLSGPAARKNLLVGNVIGLDATGAVSLGNSGGGVELNNGPNNIVGGSLAQARNIISGNQVAQVKVTGSGAAGNLIVGNYIGLSATGTAIDSTLSFYPGVLIDGAPGNQIGGANAGEGNTVSGNQWGILIKSTGADNNVIQGNFIGTTPNGSAAMPNHIGIYINNGPANNGIGGTAPGSGNVISGNEADGINIADSGGNLVQGNLIGTDGSGLHALGNTKPGTQAGGITITSLKLPAVRNQIGGIGNSAGNTISGNNFNGIQLLGSGTTGTIIQGNLIGLARNGITPLGNTGDGIDLLGAANTLVGLDPANPPTADGCDHCQGQNLISFNGGNGANCRATFGDFGEAETGTVIGYCTFHDNHGDAIRELHGCEAIANLCWGDGAPEIDRGADGPDSGAPAVQITQASVTGSALTISGYVDAGNGNACTVALYLSDTCGTTKKVLGTATGLPEMTGRFSFKETFNTNPPVGWKATANAFFGLETTEFSACKEITSDCPEILPLAAGFPNAVGTGQPFAISFEPPLPAGAALTATGLPPGLTYDQTRVTGTPQTAGTYKVLFTISRLGCTQTHEYELMVIDPFRLFVEQSLTASQLELKTDSTSPISFLRRESVNAGPVLIDYTINAHTRFFFPNSIFQGVAGLPNVALAFHATDDAGAPLSDISISLGDSAIQGTSGADGIVQLRDCPACLLANLGSLGVFSRREASIPPVAPSAPIKELAVAPNDRTLTNCPVEFSLKKSVTWQEQAVTNYGTIDLRIPIETNYFYLSGTNYPLSPRGTNHYVKFKSTVATNCTCTPWLALAATEDEGAEKLVAGAGLLQSCGEIPQVTLTDPAGAVTQLRFVANARSTQSVLPNAALGTWKLSVIACGKTNSSTITIP